MPRKLLLILLIPALLLIGAYLYLRTSLPKAIDKDEPITGKMEAVDSLGGKKTSVADLRPLFIQRMQQLLKKSSNRLYDLSIGDLQLDVLKSSVVLKDVRVRPDEASQANLRKAGNLPQNVFDLSFRTIQIEGINLDDALTRKTMDYKLVKIVGPVIHVYRGQKQPQQKSAEEFTQRFLEQMTSVDIKKLVIDDATIVVHGGNNKTNRLNNVQVNMTDILLDSSTRQDKNRFLFARDASLSFQNYTTQTKDGLYQFKIGKGNIQATQKKVTLQNLSFASPLSRQQFVKQQKQAKELYNLQLSAVSLTGIDWWTLLNGEEFIAEKMTASGGELSVYFDRTLPPKSKMGNFPNQLIAKLPMNMAIKSFSLANLDLSYTEYNPLSKQTGTIFMDNVSLTASNVSNNTQSPLLVNGTALFMHSIPISAAFQFNMASASTGAFSASIAAKKPFDGSLINAFSVPLGMMKIERGTVNGLQANMSGDQHKASGDVLLQYNDLKVALMEKETGEKVLDKKNVTSFLANLLVIKNDNPKKGKTPEKQTGSFQRDPNGGFFMLVWKTMLVGALKTIGAPEKLAYKKITDKQ